MNPGINNTAQAISKTLSVLVSFSNVKNPLNKRKEIGPIKETTPALFLSHSF